MNYNMVVHVEAEEQIKKLKEIWSKCFILEETISPLVKVEGLYWAIKITIELQAIADQCNMSSQQRIF